MRQRIPLYLLTCALLGAAAYLHSSVVAVAIVALWAVEASESVFTRKNKDADIADIQATLAAHKSKMELLTRDISALTDRARNILGENF